MSPWAVVSVKMISWDGTKYGARSSPFQVAWNMDEDGSKVTDNSKYFPNRTSMLPIFGIFWKIDNLALSPRYQPRNCLTELSSLVHVMLWTSGRGLILTLNTSRPKLSIMVKTGGLVGDTISSRNPSTKNWRPSPNLGWVRIAVGRVALYMLKSERRCA